MILSAAYLHAEFQQRPVYVIPVDTEIDNSAFHHFRTALNDAREKNASLILLHLNTYGGALDAADSIRTAIMKLDMPTVAFVDVNAASAGALIALACDSVYMAPGASMGSATVVNSQGDPMPEKYQSFMSTMMRATAEHHGKKWKETRLYGDATLLQQLRWLIRKSPYHLPALRPWPVATPTVLPPISTMCLPTSTWQELPSVTIGAHSPTTS